MNCNERRSIRIEHFTYLRYTAAKTLTVNLSRKTGKTERIRNDCQPIWRQTIVYDRIKLMELEEATLSLSIVHRHRARKKLLGYF